MATYETYQKETRVPAELPPPGSWDCQIHVFGDPARYPLRSGGAYPPPSDATFEAGQRMHRAIGIERGVVVQSTVHGLDHRILYDALAANPSYRGIAIVDDTISDKELQKLHDAGVRGARFNFWKMLNIAPTPEGFRRALDRIKAFGWHAKIHAADEDWVELKDLLSEVKIPVVIDHLGHLSLKRGLEQPSFRVLLDLLKRDNWWIMLSNADRISQHDKIWDDVVPYVQKYIAAAPDRAIWCTDWPHVRYEGKMPNDAELMEFVFRAVPDAAQRKKILVDNPSRLFA